MKPRVGDLVRSPSKVTDSTAKVGPSPLSTESIWSWTRMPAALSLNKEGQGSGVAVLPIHVGSGWVWGSVPDAERKRACASPGPEGRSRSMWPTWLAGNRASPEEAPHLLTSASGLLDNHRQQPGVMLGAKSNANPISFLPEKMPPSCPDESVCS